MSNATRAVEISKVAADEVSAATDSVATEAPMEIQLASKTATGSAAKSISITMRTPGNDEELAAGFLYTEGIIRGADDIASIERCGEPDPDTGEQNIVRVTVRDEVDIDFDRLQRHFYTTSSCGVCGKTSLDALRVEGGTSLAGLGPRFDVDMLRALPERVRRRQQVFSATGGLHAAAVFGADGEIVVVKEDVGRHNATDKAIGALLALRRLPGHGYGLLVSGRASFELMQKSLLAGIPLLAAVGAPSSLAVETATEFGMTLIGFLRGDTFNIYAGKERLRQTTESTT